MASLDSPQEPMRYYGQPDPMGLGQVLEVWQSRELLIRFFLRDLLIRYRQVFVGIVWVLVQPLMSTVIFLGLFFVLGAREANNPMSYAPVILIGMLLWLVVNNSLRDATGSLVNYRHVITKIYFPRMLLPLSGLLCALFDLLIGAGLIFPVAWASGVPIHGSTAWAAILAVAWLALFSLGCILWLSSLNALYRDVGYALPFALQIGMFVSPVVYDTNKIARLIGPERIWMYDANPVASAIGLARWGLLGSPMPSTAGMGIALLLTIALVLSGLAWFHRADRWLADRI